MWAIRPDRPAAGRRVTAVATSTDQRRARLDLSWMVMHPAGQLDHAARLRAAVARDGATCVWCGRRFGELVLPTTEHLVPRVKGGPSWAENEVAACRRCNRERGHQSLSQWADECRRRGWAPDIARVLSAMAALDEAIARRGGQRRARPYIAHQRRRLARMSADVAATR